MPLDIILDTGSAVPPYEQLRSQVAARAHDGSVPAGARLPTVRGLAADLGLAVNTVAKAYRALESDGVIETRGRAGTFVASPALSAPPADVAALVEELVAQARRRGLTVEETRTLVDRAWSHVPGHQPPGGRGRTT